MTQAEPEGTGTGDARVDEALRRLDSLAELPVTEHPPVFEDVHQRLAQALDDTDAPPPDDSPDS